MHVEISINSAGRERAALIENKDTINEVKYMSLIACGSIRPGHDRFIFVMNLKEGKRFLCVWLLYYVSNFCRFANGAGCQDIDQVFFMEIIFYLVYSAAVF